MNIRTRWALVIGLTLATISTTMLLSNNVPVVVKDGNGVSQTFMVVQNAAGGLIAENAICDGQAAAACATVKGSSSAAAATDSAMVVALTPNSPAVNSPQSGTLTWPPGTAPVTGVGTFTTSPTAGSNFVAAVQIGGTANTSPASGNNLYITSPQVGSLAPVGVIGIGSTVTVSNSAASLVAPVNCISGCTASNLSTTYNQNPATLASGATYALQGDQNGAIKVNITSALTSALAVSPSQGSLVQTGFPADAVCGTDTGTCSLIALVKRLNQITDAPLATQAGTVVVGGVGLAAQTLGGCTGQVVTSSTSNIFTQIKGSAGTLCWLRYVTSASTTASIRAYDTATNANQVCAGNPLGGGTGIQPVIMDLSQPNTISPGGIDNLGAYGQAFANGIGLCITGAHTGTDTTSATTGITVNIGWK